MEQEISDIKVEEGKNSNKLYGVLAVGLGSALGIVISLVTLYNLFVGSIQKNEDQAQVIVQDHKDIADLKEDSKALHREIAHNARVTYQLAGKAGITIEDQP